MLRQGRSAFGRRAQRGGAQRCQMARVWPRAAQYKSTAFFNRAIFLVIPLQISWHVKSELDYCKTHIRGQEGTRTLDQLIKSQLLYQLSYLPDNVYWKYNFLKSKKKIFVFVAPPAATPSRCAISSFRYAPLRPANPLRPRATNALRPAQPKQHQLLFYFAFVLINEVSFIKLQYQFISKFVHKFIIFCFVPNFKSWITTTSFVPKFNPNQRFVFC